MDEPTEHTVFTFIECVREEECGWHDLVESDDPAATLRSCPLCGAETRTRTRSIHEMQLELRQGLYSLRDNFKMIAERIPAMEQTVREQFESAKDQMILVLPDYLAAALVEITWDDNG